METDPAQPRVQTNRKRCFTFKFIFQIYYSTMSGESPTDPLADEACGVVREVGCQATWSLSSCKPGFGVEQLRDGCCDSYWQSDGQLPHLVNIQFRRKTTIQSVAIYTDYKLDESYTPTRVSVRGGTNFNDLQEIEVVDLTEPTGWIVIPLKVRQEGFFNRNYIILQDLNERLVRTFLLQIAVIQNHQQGRDTHLRQVKVHSPVTNKIVSSADFAQFSTRHLDKYQDLLRL